MLPAFGRDPWKVAVQLQHARCVTMPHSDDIALEAATLAKLIRNQLVSLGSVPPHRHRSFGLVLFDGPAMPSSEAVPDAHDAAPQPDGAILGFHYGAGLLALAHRPPIQEMTRLHGETSLMEWDEVRRPGAIRF